VDDVRDCLLRLEQSVLSEVHVDSPPLESGIHDIEPGILLAESEFQDWSILWFPFERTLTREASRVLRV